MYHTIRQRVKPLVTTFLKMSISTYSVSGKKIQGQLIGLMGVRFKEIGGMGE